MRISGGQAKGIPLVSPDSGTRPATDALREALFSSLGPLVEGAQVLDCFAGTGAYGLEALSRGAGSCLALEHNRKAVTCARRNAEAVTKACGGRLDYRIEVADLYRWKGRGCYDLVLCDPPYEQISKQLPGLLPTLASLLSEDENSRLILECPGQTEALDIPGLRLLKRIGKARANKPTLLVYMRA